MHDEGELVRMEAHLPRRYIDMCRNLGSPVSADRMLDQFDRLRTRYGESHRHHHTLRHIAHCVIEFDRVAQFMQYPDRVLAAIFYHDIVYDVSRQDNEIQSSYQWTMAARNVLCITDEDTLVEVARMIELTKRHRVDPTKYLDAALMIDIDMSILGADAPVYDRYARDVRKEYSMYSDAAWAVGRIDRFLDPTIMEGQVFLTDVLRLRYEERAIANLMEERVRLQAE